MVNESSKIPRTTIKCALYLYVMASAAIPFTATEVNNDVALLVE